MLLIYEAILTVTLIRVA